MPSSTKSADPWRRGDHGNSRAIRGAGIILYHGSVRHIIFAEHTPFVRKTPYPDWWNDM